MTPPTCTAWPSIYLVVEWVTISAPKSKGRQLMGVGERVVHDQGHTLLMGGNREGFQVGYHQGGVCQGFRKHGAGVRTHGCPQLLQGGRGGHERGFNAHFLHGLIEQVEGTAVNGAGTDHMVPGRADIQHGHQSGSLAGRSDHGPYAAFQGSDLLFHHVVVGLPRRV